KMLCLFLVFFATSTSLTAQQQPTYLYKVSFIQAAPGKLLEFIDLQKARNARTDSGDEPALWMRHSQGDRWDLMIVYPMGSYAEYYQPGRIAKRAAADKESS